MSTTQLFIELLIIGLGVAIWLFLLVASLFGYHVDSSVPKIDTVFVTSLLGIAYVLGIIVDRLAYKLFYRLERATKVKVFGSSSALLLEMITRHISTNADALKQQIIYNRSRIRICRSWIINFGLISIFFVIWGIRVKFLDISQVFFLGVIGLSFCCFSIFTFLTLIRDYYKNIQDSYNFLTQEKNSTIKERSGKDMAQNAHSNIAEQSIEIAEKWTATDFTAFFTAIRNIYTIFMAQDENVKDIERKSPEKALRIKQIIYASPGTISLAGLGEPIRALKELLEFFLTLPYLWEQLKLDRMKEKLVLTKKIIEILKTLGWEQEQIDKYVELILQNLLNIKKLAVEKKLPLPDEIKALPQPKQHEVLALLKQAETM